MDDIGPRAPRRVRSNSPGRRVPLQPGGPITATEWNDQVDWLQRQLTTMTRSVNDHAHLLGQLLHAETGQVPKLFKHVATLEEMVEKQLGTDGVVDKRFLAGGAKVQSRMDGFQELLGTLSLEIREIVARLAEPPPSASHVAPGTDDLLAPPGVVHHSIDTPQKPQHEYPPNPFSISGPTDAQLPREAPPPFGDRGDFGCSPCGQAPGATGAPFGCSPGGAAKSPSPSCSPCAFPGTQQPQMGQQQMGPQPQMGQQQQHQQQHGFGQPHPANVRFNSGMMHQQNFTQQYTVPISAALWNSKPDNDFD